MMYRKVFLVVLLAICSLQFSSCKKEDESVEVEVEEKEKQEQVIQQYLKDEGVVDFEKFSSGLYKILEKEGSGDLIKTSDSLSVHYTGVLMYGKKFDSSYHRADGTPFPMVYGETSVIDGWTEALSTMKKGEKSQFIIPSHLAYGTGGTSSGSIPPNTITIFDIEIIDILEKE